MSTQMSSADYNQSRVGRKTLRLGGREPPTWRSREGKLGHIEETTWYHVGTCQSSMCIVSGHDTQKRRRYHWAIAGERPEIYFSLAKEKRKGATRTQRLIV